MDTTGLRKGVGVLVALALTAGPWVATPAMAAAEPEAECALSGEDLASARAYLKFKKLREASIPRGVPAVYGSELGISFDRVQDAINRVRPYGPTYGTDRKIVLKGEALRRYVGIGSQTACEYCCSAKTLVRQDGVAACGCAHSIMMRGLGAYLIKNHPDMPDERILAELKAWKSAFFPKQTLNAQLRKLYREGDAGIKEVLREFPEFLPSMVGGC